MGKILLNKNNLTIKIIAEEDLGSHRHSHSHL